MLCSFSPRFFALTSLRLVFLLASALAVVVCVDTWRNKIWPEIRGVYRFPRWGGSFFYCFSTLARSALLLYCFSVLV